VSRLGRGADRALAAAGQRGLRLERSEPAEGVERWDLSSALTRRMGLVASLYRVGDLLVDTGFSHGARLVLPALRGRPLAAILCTHHHEDHLGNAGPLAAEHGCPVHLWRPELAQGEGVAALRPYRQLFWGPAAAAAPLPAPPSVAGEQRRLDFVPTPGHSGTHAVVFEAATGLLFSGDLLVATSAAAVMSHEDPDELARSLRRAAALEPRLLLSGHGLTLPDPAPRLLHKAARIEAAAEQVRSLHARGCSERAIAAAVWSRGRGHDRAVEWLTGGEFSRRNFVRACLRQPAGGPA